MKTILATTKGNAAGRDVIKNEIGTQIIVTLESATPGSEPEPDDDRPQFPEQIRCVATLMKLEDSRRLQAVEYCRETFGTGKFKNLTKGQLFETVIKFAIPSSSECGFCSKAKQTIEDLTKKNETLNKLNTAYFMTALLTGLCVCYIVIFK